MSILNDTITVGWTWEPISWTWWQLLQVVLAIAGIVGNSVVMLVLFHPRQKRCSTDTLVAGLAVADFLTSVFILPVPRVLTVPSNFLAQFYCRFIYSSLLLWISICASVFTLTLFSIERLIAVKRPFLFKRVFTHKNSMRMLVAIWILSIVVNTVVIFVVREDDNACIFGYSTPTLQKMVGIGVFLVEYFGPVIIMVASNLLTIRALNPTKSKTRTVGNGSYQTMKDMRRSQARRRVVKMFFIVTITFTVCWTPDQFFYLALNLGLVEATYLFSPLYRSFVVLAFVNSCANPIIYASWNPQFRRATQELGKAFHGRRWRQAVFGEAMNTTSDRTPASSRMDISTTIDGMANNHD